MMLLGATINICGDFDIETIKPLVEKYLGSIKKGKKPLNWVDNNKNMLPGKVTNDFKVDMQTPKVTVIEVFDAKLKEYRLLDDVALSAATYILDMRYTKSLREDEGGTYGASTHGEISIRPKPEATLQVYFDTKLGCSRQARGIEHRRSEFPCKGRSYCRRVRHDSQES